MKIKYNPLLASSIILAALMCLHGRESGEENFVFEADLAANDDAMAFMNEHKGQGLTPSSIFNAKQNALLIWAATDNDWKKDLSAKVQLAIMLKYAKLNEAKCVELGFRMTASAKTQLEYLEKLAEFGEQCADSPLIELVQLQSNAERVIRYVNESFAVKKPKQVQEPIEAPKE